MLTLAHPRLPPLPSLSVEALADTGDVHLCIPEHVRVQLSLSEQSRREGTIADGWTREVP